MILTILPIKDWDIMPIIYSLIASVLFFFILKWFGVLKKLMHYFKNKKALKKYRISIVDECNTLVVVGKRKGFSLNEVYVELDLAQSDIMLNKPETSDEPSTYVLLGGPGAGKSTTAKNKVIGHFNSDFKKTIPFFIRLKDYNSEKSIYHYLVDRLENFGFVNSVETVKKNLTHIHSLCILDGLDEVRPNLREKICNEINTFYSNYFINCGSLIVTCRKEAYRDLPLNIKDIWEVRPLSDEQIKRFAQKWPLDYPRDKNVDTFFRDLASSTKILELARSPLLLTGGLMHYTEANLGIPEERFEYLQTMAKWLVTDWANAQGRLPDSYRNVYDRILTSLSYYMHVNNVSEIPFETAAHFISDLLPTFGYRKEEASAILKSITIKTGILTRDDNNIFFAQFGLQEYFTSIEIKEKLNFQEIPKLSPTSWWREAILLFIAQLKDPTELLTLMFKTDPLLAVAGVAECPTPSILIQEKSINVCLQQIDKKNQSIKGSLVPLLRKIRDNIEINFYNQLENRLSGEKTISSIVGVSLATAGTAAATNVLAKHPEVWDICLNEAGYLSTSFENLLVDWIQEGENINAFKATDLLSKRITSDRMKQLIDILPTLNKKKKEHISQLLLKEIASKSGTEPFRSISELSIVSKLIPNISNPNYFIEVSS